MMPGITGLTVLKHIQERHPSIPEVMLTGHTSSQVAAQALAAEAWACLLVKLVDRVELDQALQSCVGTASSERPYQAIRNDIEVDTTRDGPMTISFANRP